ncbi:hypothetical protein SG34_030290 [Thalassomonas viridans]|uniref:DUF4397 domain-containing protein n=1 Tax=Thalassomonas viridans TaxID=137584 RepID=A0AAE9Z998_9GAMM|nr:hypothetical protein [Thalassomonas viridans]WDE09066.1 hypothetical protein SG34_030290 [Thalassomonas viridans]
MPFFKLALPVLAALTLAACSESDSGSSKVTDGEIKFYNTSYNSGLVSLEVTDEEEQSFILPSTHYGDVTPTYLAKTGQYDLVIEHPIAMTDNTVGVLETSFDIHNDEMSLLILSGDINEPKFISYHYDLTSYYELETPCGRIVVTPLI